jgi:hypothetical protein
MTFPLYSSQLFGIGWAVSKTSVDILLPRLRAQLATMDVNTPEVIYC